MCAHEGHIWCWSAATELSPSCAAISTYPDAVFLLAANAHLIAFILLGIQKGTGFPNNQAADKIGPIDFIFSGGISEA